MISDQRLIKQHNMKTRIFKPDPVSHTIQHKTKASNQASMSKILQAYKDRTAIVQREAMEEDDELLQGKFETAQREVLAEEDEEPFQQKTENKTGLPDKLKAGVESMSGYSMDDVRVHYNSSKPVQLQALAYTQGTDIHVGPGQEKHLSHEAWHVVQQKQGRVQPTVQMQGVQVNDDEGLEKEATIMGGKGILFTNKTSSNPNKNIQFKRDVYQLWALVHAGLNVNYFELSRHGLTRGIRVMYRNVGGRLFDQSYLLTPNPHNNPQYNRRGQQPVFYNNAAIGIMNNRTPLHGLLPKYGTQINVFGQAYTLSQW